MQTSSGPGPQVAQKKLTRWKKEPTLADLKYDVDQAKSQHDAHMNNISRWNDLLRVAGKAKPPQIKGRSSVQPKLVRRQAEWRYSALTEPLNSTTKLFKVSPTTFEDDDAAKQNELVLNWQIRTQLNKVKLVDDIIRSTVDDGTCIMRVGWKRVVVQVEEEVPIYSMYPVTSEEQVQQLQEAISLKESNPRDYEESVPPDVKEAVSYYEESGEAAYAVAAGSQTIKVDKVLENRPLVDVMNPANVIIDPSCQGDLSKAMFACIMFETCKADLQKEPSRYKNLDAVNWETASPLNNPDYSTSTPSDFQFKDAARKKVVAYEYWGYFDVDGNGELTPFVSTWIGDVIIRMEESPFPDKKLPLVLINYMPKKRELYGEADAELLEDNQKILGAVARGVIDVLGRSANGQQGFAKGMLDPLNRRRYENGQDYEFNPNLTPAAGLIEHKFPELPQSAMLMLNLQNQEAEALTGVKSFSGGLAGEAYGDVAAGIRGMLDAAAKREMAILRRVAQGITEVGMKLLSMNALFLSDKEVIRVTNKEFVTVRREDLQGNFDLEVDISTTEVDNAKAQDLGFMLQTIGPKTDPQIAMMILSEIALLKRMPTLAEKLRAWSPQPSPQEQELMELELEAKRQEVRKLQSEAALNEAKAQAEMIRANGEASGLNHARELEKQQAQARGNQELEVTKAITKPRKDGESRPDIEAAIGYNQLSDKLGLGSVGGNPMSSLERELGARTDPTLSLGSKYFSPSADPSLNLANNL